MKIVCYSYDDTGNPWCGGGGAFRIETVHSILSSQGHDITFISGKYPGADKQWNGNFKKKFIGIGKSYILSRLSYFIVANIHAIFTKADIFLAAFSPFAPVFIFAYKKNVVVEFYHLLGKRALDKYKVFGIIPFIFEKTMLFFAHTIITMAQGTKNEVLKKYPEKRVYALPCGFDQIQLKLPPIDEHYILCFGRIDIYMKGLDRLIPVMSKVLKEVPGYRLVIAGRGSEEDLKRLQTIIDESPVKEKIQVIVNPDYSTKLEMFRKCTYVAIFSRFEGWCIVAIEAAAAGKAILGVDVVGLRDSVVNGFNGVLVRDFDQNELINYGKKLLSDDTFRANFEGNARIHASKYTWEKIAEMQIDVYQEHLKSV